MLNTALIVAHPFHQMDRKNRTFTIISTTEYVVLPVESGLATSAFIISARKLVKKMTRHPCCTIHIIKQHGQAQDRWRGVPSRQIRARAGGRGGGLNRNTR